MNMLEHPEVTLEGEDGQVVSAYVEFRKGIKAVGTVQPNPSALVFFLLAQDGLPIGMRLLEPVSGVAVCEIINTLVEGPDGPCGVERCAQHHFFLGPQELSRFLAGFREGLQKLQDATA